VPPNEYKMTSNIEVTRVTVRPRNGETVIGDEESQSGDEVPLHGIVKRTEVDWSENRKPAYRDGRGGI